MRCMHVISLSFINPSGQKSILVSFFLLLFMPKFPFCLVGAWTYECVHMIRVHFHHIIFISDCLLPLHSIQSSTYFRLSLYPSLSLAFRVAQRGEGQGVNRWIFKKGCCPALSFQEIWNFSRSLDLLPRHSSLSHSHIHTYVVSMWIVRFYSGEVQWLLETWCIFHSIHFIQLNPKRREFRRRRWE